MSDQIPRVFFGHFHEGFGITRDDRNFEWIGWVGRHLLTHLPSMSDIGWWMVDGGWWMVHKPILFWIQKKEKKIKLQISFFFKIIYLFFFVFLMPVFSDSFEMTSHSISFVSNRYSMKNPLSLSRIRD